MTEIDYETCSWCTTEVPDSTLREQHDGARICRDCVEDAVAGRPLGGGTR